MSQGDAGCDGVIPAGVPHPRRMRYEPCMLDPAIIQALQAPLPPEMPQIAIERVWVSSVAEQAKRQADRLLREFEAQLGTWRVKVDHLKTATLAQTSTALFTPDEQAEIDQLIQDIEDHAEQRATVNARMAKRATRDVKRQFATDPLLAAVTRAFKDRLMTLDREIIDAMLDYALFLRAFRSDRIPDSRGGRTFDDPADLARYLDSELA